MTDSFSLVIPHLENEIHSYIVQLLLRPFLTSPEAADTVDVDPRPFVGRRDRGGGRGGGLRGRKLHTKLWRGPKVGAPEAPL